MEPSGVLSVERPGHGWPSFRRAWGRSGVPQCRTGPPSVRPAEPVRFFRGDAGRRGIRPAAVERFGGTGRRTETGRGNWVAVSG